MDSKILQQIGLTNGEVKVYLTLLKLGSCTTGPITDKSGVSRSKIYNILERLIQKGLVGYITKDKTKYFQAEDPIKLQQFLDQKENEFKEQREQIDNIMPELQFMKSSEKNVSEACIFKGFKGMQTVHEHMYQRLHKGDSFFYMGIPSYQDKKYELYWQRDHRRREKLGIISRSLFNHKTSEQILINRNKYRYMDARYMPINIDTPAWFMGYKDVTVIGLQSDDLAIEIVNQKIADSFKEYFEAFWKISKRFKL